MRVRATDLISQVSYSNTTGAPVVLPVGTNLLDFFCSPLAEQLSSARISRFGQVFEKFCFERMEFTFTSALPTSTPGSLVMAYDPDIADDTPPATTAGLQQLLAYKDSVLFNIWESSTLSCRTSSDPQKFFYTSANSADERLYFQGQYYLSLAAPVTVPATTTMVFGNVFFSYDLHLFEPALEAGASMLIQGNQDQPLTTNDEIILQARGSTPGATPALVAGAGKVLLDAATGKLTFENAGEYLVTLLGNLNVTSGVFGAGAEIASQWNHTKGSGITYTNVNGLSLPQTFVEVGAVADDTFPAADLLRVLVDAKSLPSDRWLLPAINWGTTGFPSSPFANSNWQVFVSRMGALIGNLPSYTPAPRPVRGSRTRLNTSRESIGRPGPSVSLPPLRGSSSQAAYL